MALVPSYSLVFAKNTSVSRKFGENSSKISASGGILGKDERVNYGDPAHYRDPAHPWQLVKNVTSIGLSLLIIEIPP